MSDNFKWDDSLAKEFASYVISVSRNMGGMSRDLENFKKSKEKDIPKCEWEILSGSFLNGKRHIYSVKRLTDNIVFILGEPTGFGVIKEFTIIHNNLMYVSMGNGSCISLMSIQKVEAKKALFTTEDGVEIFSWHNVIWWVNKHWFYNSSQASMYEVDNMKGSKYFSTEEKAKEYILLNKQIQLSYKEIADVLNSEYFYAPLQIIKDLFKSKINL